jgi:hypothetical protein
LPRSRSRRRSATNGASAFIATSNGQSPGNGPVAPAMPARRSDQGLAGGRFNRLAISCSRLS